jgi:hypothetical protein
MLAIADGRHRFFDLHQWQDSLFEVTQQSRHEHLGLTVSVPWFLGSDLAGAATAMITHEGRARYPPITGTPPGTDSHQDSPGALVCTAGCWARWYARIGGYTLVAGGHDQLWTRSRTQARAARLAASTRLAREVGLAGRLGCRDRPDGSRCGAGQRRQACAAYAQRAVRPAAPARWHPGSRRQYGPVPRR